MRPWRRAPIDPEVIALAGRVFDLAREGDTGELAAYLDAGVPANLTNDKGDTLLILAAYHGHPDTVAALLARGADHARVNDRGQTALAAAVFRQSAAAVRALLAAGADPDLGRPQRPRDRRRSSTCRRCWRSCRSPSPAPPRSRKTRSELHGRGMCHPPGGVVQVVGWSPRREPARPRLPARGNRHEG